MVFACGLSNYSVGVFHLANHATFKALLFLSAGSVIHAMGDEQDMRRMGGLVKLLPFTYAMFFIGSLSLMGFPFLTGFYSKDVILEVAYAKYTIASHFAHWLGTISAFFTAFYSMRLLYLTFLSKTNSYKAIINQVHDAPIRMAFPLFALSLGSIFIGYLTRDMIIGLGTAFWGQSLFTLPENLVMIDAEFLPHSIKIMPVIFSLSGAFFALIFYSLGSNFLVALKLSSFGKSLYNFLNRKWFWDKVYNEQITQKALFFGYHTSFKVIDRGLIEMLGPFGISNLIYKKSLYFKQLNTGVLYHYAFFMLIGIIFIITTVVLLDFTQVIFDTRILLLFILLVCCPLKLKSIDKN
jgi:NADH-ubiquinone oxidoreductase chain 5